MLFKNLIEAYDSKEAFLADHPEPALLIERHGESKLASVDTPDDQHVTPLLSKTWDDDVLPKWYFDTSEVVHPRAEVAWLCKSDRNPFAGLITLGRAGNNDIILGDRTVSKMHVIFHARVDGWLIEDRNSTNGTYLNSVRLPAVERYHVTDGVRIQLGLGVVARYFEPESLWDFCELLQQFQARAHLAA